MQCIKYFLSSSGNYSYFALSIFIFILRHMAFYRNFNLFYFILLKWDRLLFSISREFLLSLFFLRNYFILFHFLNFILFLFSGLSTQLNSNCILFHIILIDPFSLFFSTFLLLHQLHPSILSSPSSSSFSLSLSLSFSSPSSSSSLCSSSSPSSLPSASSFLSF